MKLGTPNIMVYGETGVFPFFVDIQCRVISLVTCDILKLSGTVYSIMFS